MGPTCQWVKPPLGLPFPPSLRARRGTAAATELRAAGSGNGGRHALSWGWVAGAVWRAAGGQGGWRRAEALDGQRGADGTAGGAAGGARGGWTALLGRRRARRRGRYDAAKPIARAELAEDL
jgi:hypothetical protein